MLFDDNLVASPSIINEGQPFGVTWNGTPGEAGDWMGLYSVGAPDTNPWLWVHAEASSYTWLLPGVFPDGDYEFRLFDDYSFEQIGESNTIHIQDPSQPFLIDDEPIDTRPQPQPATSKVVYDLSNVSWNEGAPNVDATYFDTISFANGNVSYVTTSAPGPLPYGGSIKLTLELAGGPVVWSDGGGKLTSAGAYLYIQRAGDNWSADGEYNAYRVWADKPLMFSGAKAGQFTITVPLADTAWNGVLTDVTAAQFAATLANPGAIGFTLLNGQGKGKGEVDYTSSDGVASLNVVEFKVLAP
jgi:hypothetical protein